MGIKTKGLNVEGVISIIFTRETTLPQLMQAAARRPIVLAIEPGSEGDPAATCVDGDGRPLAPPNGYVLPRGSGRSGTVMRQASEGRMRPGRAAACHAPQRPAAGWCRTR